MSPRAAWRLEGIGFQRVYDYAAGKADWGAAGLRLEGTLGARAGDVARSDVPTCRFDERLAEVRDRVREAGWQTCVVLNDEGIVLGQVGEGALDAGSGLTVEEIMDPGPSTVRPSASIETIRRRI